MSWTCPYCNHVATIQNVNLSSKDHVFNNGNKYEAVCLLTSVTVCPNSKCKEFTLKAALYKAQITNSGTHRTGDPIQSWMLKPQSAAKPMPDYVPSPIRSDYEEACLIATLSPKASATLSRRCLQGMIRDFWKITKPRLVDEINALEEEVDPLTWSAIDAVRSIGNIGAHMEKDISLIVEVDADEASLLIGLIETLINDWYVDRHNRQERMAAIVAVAVAKRERKDQSSRSEDVV